VSVVDKELIDWKFVCADIWMEHFQDSRTMPPPFNLIQLLIHGTIYLVRKCIRRKDPMSVWDCQYKAPDPGKKVEYKKIVSSLKDRLRLKLDSKKESSKPGSDAPVTWNVSGKGDVSGIANQVETPKSQRRGGTTPENQAGGGTPS